MRILLLLIAVLLFVMLGVESRPTPEDIVTRVAHKCTTLEEKSSLMLAASMGSRQSPIRYKLITLLLLQAGGRMVVYEGLLHTSITIDGKVEAFGAFGGISHPTCEDIRNNKWQF
jgi:hypothetical protein